MYKTAIEEKEETSKSIRYIETEFILSMGLILLATFTSVKLFTGYEGIILGVILFILDIPCYFIAKKGKISFWINITINSIACGSVISGYFLVEKKPLDLTAILAAAVCCLVMLISIELLYRMKSHPQLAFLLAWVLQIGLIIGCITFWTRFDACGLQYGFFLLIQMCCYLLILRKREIKSQELKKTMAAGSFGIFLAVLVAVLTILTEGDALDWVDLDAEDVKLLKKQKIKKRI